ncbi:MAG: hypothetical protein ABIN58_06605 [candidate division WOR-3 bacterium]
MIKLRWQIYSRQSVREAWRLDDVTSTHVIYETCGEPLPCDVGTPVEDYKQPWYTILDRATQWAAGKPSWADATDAITKNVYDMPLFDYPRYDPSAVPPIDEWPFLCSFASVGSHAIELDADAGTTPTDPDGTNGLYPLLPHSADLGGQYAPISNAKAQCTDAASILIVLFRAMGVDSTTLLIDDPGGPDWFGTKDINPIGAPGWTSMNWNYHHLGDLHTASPAGPLYDACLALDADGRHTRHDVVGDNWSTYQSKLWNGSGTFNIHGRYPPGIVQPHYHDVYRQGSEPF